MNFSGTFAFAPPAALCSQLVSVHSAEATGVASLSLSSAGSIDFDEEDADALPPPAPPDVTALIVIAFAIPLIWCAIFHTIRFFKSSLSSLLLKPYAEALLVAQLERHDVAHHLPADDLEVVHRSHLLLVVALRVLDDAVDQGVRQPAVRGPVELRRVQITISH